MAAHCRCIYVPSLPLPSNLLSCGGALGSVLITPAVGAMVIAAYNVASLEMEVYNTLLNNAATLHSGVHCCVVL